MPEEGGGQTLHDSGAVFQTVIGLVYNPVLEQLYSARRGTGSFCNGRQLHVTNTTRQSRSHHSFSSVQ